MAQNSMVCLYLFEWREVGVEGIVVRMMVAWYVSTYSSDYTYFGWIDHGIEDMDKIVYHPFGLPCPVANFLDVIQL